MTTTFPAPDPAVPAERHFDAFENLMPFRVNDILLVSSLYDSFILREDGRLNELLIGESLELEQHQVPGMTHVSSGAEALDLVRSQPRFNLIVSNLHVVDMDAAQLAREVRNAGLRVPVMVLAYDYREITHFIGRNPQTDIERIFLWQGNARILISMVKYIEDKRNVHHDTKAMDVPVILVVEDDIRYYSLFLPVIYTELISSIAPLAERRHQCRPQAGADARPSQDPAVFGLRECRDRGEEIPRSPAGGGVRCGVPASGHSDTGGRLCAGAYHTHPGP